MILRLLALDVGERRIGLALSDATGTLARPWQTVTRTGTLPEVAADLAERIAVLEREEDGLGGIVIGLPTRLDGTPNEQTPRVRALAEALRGCTALPLHFQDERLTSREAESRLARRQRDWRRRKQRLDAAAAAIILQDYLDGRDTG